MEKEFFGAFLFLFVGILYVSFYFKVKKNPDGSLANFFVNMSKKWYKNKTESEAKYEAARYHLDIGIAFITVSIFIFIALALNKYYFR